MSTPVLNTPGTLPYDCYPPTPQELYNDFVRLMQSYIADNYTGVVKQATEPAAKDRDKMWYNTNTHRFYEYVQGAWLAAHPIPPNDTAVHLFWPGTEADLWGYDGGDGTATAGAATGPMWVKNASMDGRFPLGQGTIPGTDPAVTVTSGATVDSAGVEGEYAHELTGEENGPHTHGPLTDDSAFLVIKHTGSNSTERNSGNGLFPEDATTGESGEGTAHNNMPPYRAGFWAKRSARVYYRA